MSDSATSPLVPSGARAPFVLRVDDDGRGELEIRAAGSDPAARVALPARCVRLVLTLLFAQLEAAVTPPQRDPRPLWRRGRPTLDDLAAKLAMVAGGVPVPPETVSAYLQLINRIVARAAPGPGGRGRVRLVEQRLGGGLAAPLLVPGFATDPPQRVLQAYADRYVKSLVDPSLDHAFRARLKQHAQELA